MKGIENSFLCFICGRVVAIESDKEKDFHVNSCLDLQEGGEGELSAGHQKENTENSIVLGTATASMDKENSVLTYPQTDLVSNLRNAQSNSGNEKVNVNIRALDPPAGNKKSKALVKVNASTIVNISAPNPNPPKAKRKPRSATAGADSNKKLELEFNKLSNSAQINFLQSKIGILQHISPDASLNPDNRASFMEFAAECMNVQVSTSEIMNTINFLPARKSSIISADVEPQPKQPPAMTAISSYRLELGEILAKEAEFKAKEKKIRAAIKKMQRNLQLSAEFKHVEGAERDPVSYALQLLFPMDEPCAVESRDDSSGSGSSGSSSSSCSKRPLWQLSFQREDFDCLADTKRVRQERDAVLVYEEVIIAEAYIREDALTQQVIVTGEGTAGTSLQEVDVEGDLNRQECALVESEKSLFSQLVDELNATDDHEVEEIHPTIHCLDDKVVKSTSSSTAQLLHEEFQQLIETLMQSVGTWGRGLPEAGVKYLEDTIITWEQCLDTRIPHIQRIISIFDNWRSNLSEAGGTNDIPFERLTNLMWSKAVMDFTDSIYSYFERVIDESHHGIDSLLYRDVHSLVAISLKILSLLFKLQPSQDQPISPGYEIGSEYARINFDDLRNDDEYEAVEKESTEENAARLSPPFEQAPSDSSSDVISISPSLPPLTQKRQRSGYQKTDNVEIICLISPPVQVDTLLAHPVGDKKDLAVDVDEIPSDNRSPEEKSRCAYEYDPYYDDYHWDDDYIYSAVDFYEPEKCEVGSSDAAVVDIDLRNDGYVHTADVTREKEVGPPPMGEGAAASQPSHSVDRAVAEVLIENQHFDVLQSDREPSFESMQVYALRDICLQYGLKTDSSRDKMISILRALWRRMHPTPSSSSSSSSSSQIPSYSSQGMKRHGVRDRVDYAVATLPSSSQSPSSKDNRHRSEILSQDSHHTSITATAKSKRPKLCRDDLVQFIRRDDKLYEQVLLFVPLDLDPLHSTIKVHYDVSKTKLRQFLDELKVFVSGPSSSTSKSGARR